METLMSSQGQLGDEIERVITNFKKDSPDRKTSAAYYQTRLARLQDLATEFKERHNSILTIAGNNRTHQYFVKDYFTEILARVSHYTQIFQQAIANMAPAQGSSSDGRSGDDQPTAAAKHSATLPGVDEPQNVNLLIRKQRSMTQSLQRQFEWLGEDHSQWTPEFCQVKKDTISGLWQQIQDINFAIYEQVDTPEEYGYDEHSYIGLEHEVQKVLMTLIATSNKATSQPETKAVMPKIQIQKFTGEYSKWPQFRDLYLEIIHKSSLPTIQKCWYLKSILEGDALKLKKTLFTDNGKL